MKYILQFLRILVGLLFIFSGLVKANDPSGLANKMIEFFEPGVLNFPSLIPHALAFSVLMIAFEIIAGVALLLGFAYRIFSFLLLLLTLFFTFLTAYVYYWDVIMHSAKVRECGCFGDCIKISNSATFWKDVVLLVLVIILFIYRNRIRPLFPKYPNTALFILSVFFAFGIQWWALEHLPFYDCMPYKIGNSICEKRLAPPGSVQDSFNIVFIYKKDGVTKEFGSNNLPWQDSTWVYVDRKDKLVRKGNADPEIKDFAVHDFAGNDYTEPILQEPGYTFLIFLKDPVHARTDHMDRLKSLCVQAQQQHIPVYVLSTGTQMETEAWQKKWVLPGIELYTFDGTASKTAMRADPGLMLLEKCVIRGKWSFRDYPSSVTLNNGKILVK